MVPLFHPETLEKGAFYLHQGQNCDKLSFIRSGLLRIYVRQEDGREVTQWISSPSYFITDLASLIFGQPARWTIQTLSRTELYTISRKDYEALGNRLPRWHALEKLFLAKCFMILEERVFEHLSLSAEERYERFFETNKDLFRDVPLQYLASMLGMTPETFSRIRRRKLKY